MDMVPSEYHHIDHIIHAGQCGQHWKSCHICLRGFIFVFIYALTDLMDGNRSSIFWEFLKATYGLMIIYTTGDWFGMSRLVSYTNSFVLLYFIISIGVTLYLATENKRLQQYCNADVIRFIPL